MAAGGGAFIVALSCCPALPARLAWRLLALCEGTEVASGEGIRSSCCFAEPELGENRRALLPELKASPGWGVVFASLKLLHGEWVERGRAAATGSSWFPCQAFFAARRTFVA